MQPHQTFKNIKTFQNKPVAHYDWEDDDDDDAYISASDDGQKTDDGRSDFAEILE